MKHVEHKTKQIVEMKDESKHKTDPIEHIMGKILESVQNNNKQMLYVTDQIEQTMEEMQRSIDQVK